MALRSRARISPAFLLSLAFVACAVVYFGSIRYSGSLASSVGAVSSSRVSRMVGNAGVRGSKAAILRQGLRCKSSAEVLDRDVQVYGTHTFPELKNDLLLRAARGEPTEQVPVWIHRQAGRYLPEFRAIAEKNGYMKCFNTPEIAAELTVQPIEKYGMDAAILFSDILVLLPVMGVEWSMTAGVEPFAVNAFETPEDVDKALIDADTVDIYKSLGYVFESVTMTRQKLEGKAPLIGFSGAPWTLFTYTLHSKDTNGREAAVEFIKKYPESARKILKNASKIVVKYLIAKVEAGAQMLQVFDSWAGILSEEDFEKYSLPYLLQIAEEVKSGLRERGIEPVPMTVFPRGCGHSLAQFEDSLYDVVSLDENVDPAYAREQLPSKTLQGNFQGKFIYENEDKIRQETSDMVKRFGTQRYIANFGYAVEKDHDPKSIGVFVDQIRKTSTDINKNKAAETTEDAKTA